MLEYNWEALVQLFFFFNQRFVTVFQIVESCHETIYIPTKSTPRPYLNSSVSNTNFHLSVIFVSITIDSLEVRQKCFLRIDTVRDILK